MTMPGTSEAACSTLFTWRSVSCVAVIAVTATGVVWTDELKRSAVTRISASVSSDSAGAVRDCARATPDSWEIATAIAITVAILPVEIVDIFTPLMPMSETNPNRRRGSRHRYLGHIRLVFGCLVGNPGGN